ncbi:MAG: Tm-1-like ATP-binding domain-containing protein [Anaerolineae bacterium]|nr:Tm-1-like ATP-binding domain-containing protein [Anaerolineae bacterium]
MNRRNCTVVIVATLDTKGEEAAYVRDHVAAWGVDTILIDPGILPAPAVEADVSRERVAEAAGTTLEALLARDDKARAIATQTEGLIRIVLDLHQAGRLQGIVGLGGGQGTSIGTAAMRALPIGVPKLMLSTVASGNFQFGPYVGTKDLCMMHSITDVLGLNAISRPILRNAANAIAGMALHYEPEAESATPTIAITMLGITTPCVMRIKATLERQGYDVVPFHANGTSGPAMEGLIEQGKFVGVIDLSTHEVIDQQHGGLAGAPRRLEALARTAIPAVVSVGGSDYLLFESVQKAPEKYRTRAHMVHNAQMTCFAPTPDEMVAAAREMIERLNRALGPVIVVLPSRGFSRPNREGDGLYVPEGNRAVIAEFEAALRPEIPVVVVDLHLNDPPFADLVAGAMERLLQGEAPHTVAARVHNGGSSG